MHQLRLKSLLLGWLLLLVQVSVAADRFPILREQVVALLHLENSGPALVMPYAFSRVSAPKLRVVGKDGEASNLRLRIGCQPTADCLPFFAVVQFHSAEEGRRFAEAIICATPTLASRNSVLVRPGELAHLEMRISERVTVRIDVRCLQAGKLDEMIRARDEQTRKLYCARVLGSGKLRASL